MPTAIAEVQKNNNNHGGIKYGIMNAMKAKLVSLTERVTETTGTCSGDPKMEKAIFVLFPLQMEIPSRKSSSIIM